MMKSLNPCVSTHKGGTLDSFWLKLFKKLYKLCTAQLILCPHSEFHTNESSCSPYFKDLKRMYELLSHGVAFHNADYIKGSQIYEHAQNWISGKYTQKLKLETHEVVSGNINAWQDRLIITANFQYPEDLVNDLRKTRKGQHNVLSGVFRRWQTEKNKTFEKWFEEESMSFGRGILKAYAIHLKRVQEAIKGRGN